MSRAWLDLGTNLSHESSLRRGLELLRACVTVVRTSSVYRSPAWGPQGQPDFHNVSVEIETDMSPPALRHLLREVEAAAGRVRTANKFAPRCLDLDLIVFADVVDESLPHSQLDEQRFVLEPLCEIAGDMPHPRDGRPLRDHLARLPTSPLTLVGPPP